MHSKLSINVRTATDGTCFPNSISIKNAGTRISFCVQLLDPILGRTLVLVAHPDDEAIGCGILLQRMREPVVAFATDGAPRSSFFWAAHGSRESYATLRWSEATRALAFAGVHDFCQLSEWNPIADQELFLNLECAYKSLCDCIESELPQAILSLAYEGGHPDHDCCSFLAAIAGTRYELPVWEMPLYHRANGVLAHQAFIQGGEIVVTPSSKELTAKRAMFSAYESQAQVLADFSAEVELVRSAKNYDFALGPHSGLLNYEAWGWPIRGEDLCRAFARFLDSASHTARERRWGSAA
jgi:N-acetylglucosamine malate deacetylase 2